MLWFKCFIAVVGPFFVHGGPSPLVELSYTYDENTPNYPLHKKYLSEVALTGKEEFGIWLATNNFCSSEHSGTHMDAPLHFIENGKTIDLIPYEKLYRVQGVKVDILEKAKIDSNYQVTIQDMEDWISTNGDLPDGVVILIESGWEKKVHDSDAYSGIDEKGNLNFPEIGKEAAQWMVDYANKTGQKYGVLGVGIDTYSFDAANNAKTSDAHIILLGNEIYGLENMKNIHLLPPRGFTLTMLPMKIGKGTGGPTRVVAELGGTPFVPYNSSTTLSCWVGLILASLALLKLNTR